MCILFIYLFIYLLRDDCRNSSNKRTSKQAGHTQKQVNRHLQLLIADLYVNSTSILACISQENEEKSVLVKDCLKLASDGKSTVYGK